jgi:class 3 adenylate cyclase/tetratricopeptide (TPR) repeat protein
MSSELLDLVERLAENTHDVWARQRLLDGWKYGPRRNDELREHPGLVAYSELAESEKEYDRKTVMETVKTLLALGFEIVSPSRRSEQGDVSTLRVAAEAAVARGSKLGLQQIVAFWNSRRQALWANVPEIYRLLGEEVLKLGEPLLAYDILREGLDSCPGDVRLRQLFALALARSGAAETAIPVLEQLRQEGHSDEETLGLLARSYKDLAESGQPQCRQMALDLYREAYQRSGGYWTGINAATLALLEKNVEEARRLARDVKAICLAKLAPGANDRREEYWLHATLGEAALILGDWNGAAGHYREAARLAGDRYGDLSSTRRNARMLLRCLEGDRQLIESCFAIPRVAVFTGHMIDKPERKSPRFPWELETTVRRAITESLVRRNIGMGYCSVACGSDILFAEEILKRNGELHVVLPYEAEKFIGDSVDIIAGTAWRERCEAVLASAASVTVAAEHTVNWGATEYEYANLLLQGLAAVRARQLDTEFIGVAVWDGRKGDGNGGTASTIARWRAFELETDVIPLAEILKSSSPDAAEQCVEEPPSSPRGETLSNFVPDIVGLLFADAVGFSKLREDELPGFVRHFLGMVGDLADRSAHQPLFRNTWGDGIYMVFGRVADAGSFALELSGLIARTDWRAKGLRDLKLRIGVHAGPVFRCLDPVTHAANYMGSNVSRAARIEPITPPGHVYASQPFAALASLERGTGFTAEYVGQIGMAKHYGVFPTYVLRGARDGG